MMGNEHSQLVVVRNRYKRTTSFRVVLRRSLLLALTLGGATKLFVLLFRRVEVAGDSMLPTYAPGDRLLTLRRSRAFRSGDVVVVRDPRDPHHELIKRVDRVFPNGSLYLLGDNPQHSTDSRVFGPVQSSNVIGRVVRRY
ncbi:MAG: nickel-type superoxide dismutase maturation protease [Acidimicrobiales bacterium]